jgi:hypothetical protein
VIVDRAVELNEFFLQRLAQPGDALGQTFVAQAPRALTFGGDHLNDLAPASDQIGEKSCHLVRHLPQLRLGRFGEVSDHSRIDWIGLGPFAECLGEGAHLSWIDHHDRQACANQTRGDNRLKAPGGQPPLAAAIRL